jgi:hypothetical protein
MKGRGQPKKNPQPKSRKDNIMTREQKIEILRDLSNEKLLELYAIYSSKNPLIEIEIAEDVELTRAEILRRMSKEG